MNNRRNFLSNAIALGSGLAASPLLTTSRALGQDSSVEKSPFRFGTCDWTLKSPLTTDSFHTVKEVGLTGLQYSFGLNGEGVDLRNRSHREIIRKTVAETGVSIASLGMAILNKLPYATHDDSQQIVADCLETMAAMKQEADALQDRELASKVAPKIALMGFFGKGDINGKPDQINQVIARLKEVAPTAEKHGLTLGIESLLSETDHRRIIDGVGSSAVKVYYDTANSHGMGYDIYREMKSLGSEYICQIHLKEKKSLIGKGEIDFSRVRDTIREIGYDDWLILEGSLPKKAELIPAYQQNAKYLHSVFDA